MKAKIVLASLLIIGILIVVGYLLFFNSQEEKVCGLRFNDKMVSMPSLETKSISEVINEMEKNNESFDLDSVICWKK